MWSKPIFNKGVTFHSDSSITQTVIESGRVDPSKVLYLTISTSSATKLYDGSSLSVPSATIESFVDNDGNSAYTRLS